MKKLFLITVITILLQSCGGEIKREWMVDDFSNGKIFKLKAPKNKTYSSAIVLIEGKVNQDICFRVNQLDSTECRKFSKDTTFMKSRYDFYGGEFTYQLLPSTAKGALNITIKLPYH